MITALIGAALGLPLGIFLAALVTRALGQYDLRFELPLGQLVVLAVVAVFAGLLAAIALPAGRRSSIRYGRCSTSDRSSQIETLTGNVASHAAVPRKSTTPKPSSTRRSAGVRSFVEMPAKKSTAAKRTTPST